MAQKIGMHCYISGKVQGVWYRASAKKRALELNITGWVRNLADGRVEVLCFGEEQAIQQFCEWLQQGPPGAQVTAIEQETVPCLSEMTQFEII